jgi:UDP-N-acetylglucosamine--N-acetylmuramyl-(pentapeptide) pyrophosphoryl-undecaprenol N-acetylglucosamine transferase
MFYDSNDELQNIFQMQKKVKEGIQILWQCGKGYFEEYKRLDLPGNIKLLPFIERMDLAYAVADVIISRAGATSISELTLVGKPCVLVPSPNVTEDHQTKNAKAIVERGAAILIKEADLESEFKIVFEAVIKDKGKLQSLEQNIKRLALPNATKAIVEEIKKLIK